MLTRTKQTRTIWVTSDGVEHASETMADQHVFNAELIELIGSLQGSDAQDVLNSLSSTHARHILRGWLDACDQMEKDSLNGK